MRNGIVVALLVLVLVVGAGAGYVAGISEERTVTTTQMRTVTTTQMNTTPTPTTTTQVTCIDSGPTDGVELRVVANNGSWEGVKISGEAVGYCGSQKQVTILGPVTTNSTGWASFLEYGYPGIYYLDVNETSWIYNLSIVTQPMSVTYAILNLSTGNVTTHFCEFNVHCITGAG